MNTQRRRAAIVWLSALSLIILSLAAPALAQGETSFRFDGGGWGHGIGMSQYGAKGYASAGRSYDWILAHFYQGTRIETRTPELTRVNLDDGAAGRSSWRIQSGVDTSLTVARASDGSLTVSIAPSKSVWVVPASGGAKLLADKVDSTGNHVPDTSKVLAIYDSECYAFTGSTATSVVKMLSASGPYNATSQLWRGTLRFRPVTVTSGGTTVWRLKCVNYVWLEDYVRGVVPCESGSTWPIESLKAQAVAARSYAYENAKGGDTLYCTTRSQVYGGKSREKATTNAAVAATAGELVWYENESHPVRTYFFSSSGGHTANVEDVWTSSSPRPYYTGVDGGESPSTANYSWSAGPYSATTLSDKLRTKDLSSGGYDYSVKSPAKVVAVVAERADSGFAHHVRITWSNGATYRISGDTLRSALGMKSSKYAVVTINPPTTRSYEENNAALALRGRWAFQKDTAWSGGGAAYTSLPASSLTARFTGTAISVIGDKGPSKGVVSVVVDGRAPKTIDLYSPTTIHGAALFTTSGLASTTHTMTITLSATKNAASSATRAVIDRLVVTDGSLAAAPRTPASYEETSPLVAWLGAWVSEADSAASSGARIASTDASGVVSLRFYGTAVSWVGKRAAGMGKARVTIDGVATDVDCASGPATPQTTLWTSATLDQSRVHTLEIAPIAASGGVKPVSADALVVNDGWAVSPTLATTTAQENARSVAYAGSWTTAQNALLSGGAHRFSRTAGASATLRFQGTSVTWLGTRATVYGKAAVYLDGAYVTTLDLYSPTRKYRQPVFTRSGLACRPHTLTIKVLGAKRAAATDRYVSIDAFSVNGRAIP